MTVVDFTFPQQGDNDYSENFGTWLGRSNITDYVEEGMTFTVDYGVPEVTISQGKAFISTPDATISANSETRLTLDYCIIKPSTTVSLTDSDINHIYLTPNVGTNDSPSFDAFTNEANASSDALKIGEIDTTNDTKDESFNRAPNTAFDTGSFGVALNIPVYDLTSEASGAEGDVIWITGDDSDTAGFYVHNGNSFNQADLDEINELNDVTGVTALIEDSSANRPAAGTEGRIFFNTTDNSVEYDSGASWVTLGQDPAQIGAGDLGFDPATQSELDSHDSDGDAHHSKTVALDELNDSDLNDINVDLESNRPTAGTSGRFFLARDTQKIFYDNGSSWVLLGVANHNDLLDISSDDHHVRPTAGDGLTDSSNTFNVDVSQFAGAGLQDDGADNLQHNDTSTQANVAAAAGAAITDVDVDDFGHVTSIGTTDFDGRFVNDTGDTITGQLNMEGEFNANNASGGRVVLPVGTDMYAT